MTFCTAPADARTLAQHGLSGTVIPEQVWDNVVQPQGVEEYMKRQGATNSTLFVIRTDAVTRFAGKHLVPFTAEAQRVLVQAFEETLLPDFGPVEMTAYREYFPDPRAVYREAEPGVEVSLVVSWVVNRSADGSLSVNETFTTSGTQAFYARFFVWGSLCLELGNWPASSAPQIVALNYNSAWRTGGFVLHPLLALDAVLAVSLDPASGQAAALSAWQASAVAQAINDALLTGSIGTLVEAVGYGLVGAAPSGGSAMNVTSATATAANGRPLVQLEVTLYTCRDNATVASPQCEQQVLAAVLARVAQDTQVQQQWREAGVIGVELLAASPRQPPLPATVLGAGADSLSGGNSSSSGGSISSGTSGGSNVSTRSTNSTAWVPWHLDRLDQRRLPLDGQFDATATGAGVNVYLISSGVMAEHEEFQPMNGSSGTRVRPAWGYFGLNSSQDCSDYWAWHGYGTFAASLCCGLRLGAAKDATIYSVRFREKCLSAPGIFGAGSLPSAMDAVLSTYKKPAVVLIDTWWSMSRTVDDLNATLAQRQQLLDRLSSFHTLGIPVVAAAGYSFDYATPCENVIASHAGVISVASSDTRDQATFLGPTNSTCIDIWAPSGGLGVGLIGASPAGPHNYTRVIDRSFGSASIVAGVVAQYLQYHPNATSDEVKTALQAAATPDQVTGTGSASPNLLVFSNVSTLSSPAQEGAAGPSSAPPSPPPPDPTMGPVAAGDSSGSGGSSLSSGAVAGIAASIAVAALAVATAAFALVRRRRRRLGASEAEHDGQHEKPAQDPSATAGGWEVSPGDIEVCRQPDGSEWLLGVGRYGRVYKALKGGVQVVAIKRLNHIDARQKALFVKEIDMMKYVSRDANVTQFYGACIQGDDMMLVAEYMEGGDLHNLLAGTQAEEWRWWRRGKELMLDVVRGTHFLHSSQVVHRDIKSKNILLSRGGRAKLADVGLALLVGHEGGQGASGGPGEAPSQPQGGFAGTLAWAAPEVLTGGEASSKSDVYSLGVVLWEVVTGETPRRGRLRDPLVPQECPQEVADAIRACMQANPALRPTARQLYALLSACEPARDPQARPPLPSAGSSCELPTPPCGAADGTAGTAEGTAGPAEGNGTGSAANGAGGPASAGSSRSSSSRDGSVGGRVGGETEGRPGGGSSTTTTVSAVEELLTPHPSALRPRGGGPLPTDAVMIDFSQLTFCTNPDGSELLLGKGSFGAVHRVLLDGVQPLAAKCVELGSDPKTHAAFMQEAAMLWRLRHKHVVGLSGVCIHQGKGYLLMELLEGGSLFNMLNAQSKATQQRLFAWHNSLKITHFDIKSSNALLTREFSVKVSDVGLARIMSASHYSLSFEDSVGTFDYVSVAASLTMAPELMAGNKCTQAVDIFSFGVLLWEIVTGNRPIRGRMEPPLVPQDCPQTVVDLYQHCTLADPLQRPTAREVVQALLRAGAPQAQSMLVSQAAQAR
ncbi:hypothetical protein N2152v2_008455 [Parachlorella kessleri]